MSLHRQALQRHCGGSYTAPQRTAWLRDAGLRRPRRYAKGLVCRAENQQQPSDAEPTTSGRSGPSSLSSSDELPEALARMDAMLESSWQKFKRDLAKELPSDQASMVEEWSLDDVADGEKVFRRIAETQLGPLLAAAGCDEDPYTFFLDLLKMAAAIQLGSAAALFYGAELGLGADAGDGFRLVAALFLGYFLRIFIKIEHLVWPLYDGLARLVAQDTVYEVAPATPAERQATLNALGAVMAAACLLPKVLWGWQNEEVLQIVLPLAGGMFMFDMCYLAALVWKLRLWEE